MSSADLNPESTSSASPRRRTWPFMLLGIAVVVLLAMNGWLAYQTWTLNQTLSEFVAQRAAFANGAFPAGSFPAGQSADTPAQTAEGTGFARRRGQEAPVAASADAADQTSASDPTSTNAAGQIEAAPAAVALEMAGDVLAAGDLTETTVANGAPAEQPATGRGPRAGAPGQDAPATGNRAADNGAVPRAGVMTNGQPGGVAPSMPPAPAETDGASAPVTVTASETATATALSAVLSLPSIPVVTGVKGARVWDDGGKLLATYDSGATLTATGRSAKGDWLIVDSEAGPGWVQASELIAYGVQQLPEATLSASTALAPVFDRQAAGALASLPDIALPETVTATLPVIETPAESVPTPTAGVFTAPAANPAAEITATVTISDARLNVRSGPGVEYPIIAKASPGAVYAVIGRNETGDWLQLRLDDAGGTTGWADAAYLAVMEDIHSLPEAPAPFVPANTSATNSGPASAGPTAVKSTNAQASGLQGTIVFQQSRGSMIYAYHLATGVLTPLAYGFDPAISPDGSTVAFSRDGGQMGIYLIGIDGSNERRIFARPSLSSPKWSPDGAWIVFSRNDDYLECYQVGPNQCLLPNIFFDRFPFAQPGQFPLVKDYKYKLSAIDPQGQNFHDIPALDSARAPDWSAGGIVYQSLAGLQRTEDQSGFTTQTVAFDNLNPYYFDPDWAPDGGQIAFQLKGAAQTDIWVVNPDGSGMHGLTAPATTLVDQMPSNVAPSYSPDGTHIVFLSNRTDKNSAGPWRIWVMNADGSEQRPLAIDVPLDYSYGLEQAVSWGG